MAEYTLRIQETVDTMRNLIGRGEEIIKKKDQLAQEEAEFNRLIREKLANLDKETIN